MISFKINIDVYFFLQLKNFLLFTVKCLVIYTDVYTKDDLKRKSLYILKHEWPSRRITHITFRREQVIILTISRFGPTKCIHYYTLSRKSNHSNETM